MRRPPTRRGVLALSGSALLAGCSSLSPDALVGFESDEEQPEDPEDGLLELPAPPVRIGPTNGHRAALADLLGEEIERVRAVLEAYDTDEPRRRVADSLERAEDVRASLEEPAEAEAGSSLRHTPSAALERTPSAVGNLVSETARIELERGDRSVDDVAETIGGAREDLQAERRRVAYVGDEFDALFAYGRLVESSLENGGRNLERIDRELEWVDANEPDDDRFDERHLASLVGHARRARVNRLNAAYFRRAYEDERSSEAPLAAFLARCRHRLQKAVVPTVEHYDGERERSPRERDSSPTADEIRIGYIRHSSARVEAARDNAADGYLLRSVEQLAGAYNHLAALERIRDDLDALFDDPLSFETARVARNDAVSTLETAVAAEPSYFEAALLDEAYSVLNHRTTWFDQFGPVREYVNSGSTPPDDAWNEPLEEGGRYTGELRQFCLHCYLVSALAREAAGTVAYALGDGADADTPENEADA
ncbi:hypothetical protein ACNS7O_10850 [Haloferacaceae archaeon DSL9]